VISMSIGIGAAWNRSHDSIVVSHPRELQLRSIFEARARNTPSTSARGGYLVREVVLSHHLE
jgi:hypothetical protein